MTVEAHLYRGFEAEAVKRQLIVCNSQFMLKQPTILLTKIKDVSQVSIGNLKKYATIFIH